jgi:hypothetical protein
MTETTTTTASSSESESYLLDSSSEKEGVQNNDLMGRNRRKDNNNDNNGNHLEPTMDLPLLSSPPTTHMTLLDQLPHVQEAWEWFASHQKPKHWVAPLVGLSDKAF